MRYDPSKYPVRVSSSPIDKNALLVSGLEGREELSKLFTFDVQLIAPVSEPDIDFNKVVGATLGIEARFPLNHGDRSTDGPVRYFHGLVCRLDETSRDQHFTHFHAELVPSFWLTTLNKRCRIFQNKTVKEILQAVLKEYEFEFKLEVNQDYPAYNYCVQFEETDFQFLSRLMEQEGIHYYFTFRGDNHTLVVSDTVASPALPRFGTIPYDAGSLRDYSRIRKWQRRQHMASALYATSDYCFELAGRRLDPRHGIAAQVQGGEITHQTVPACAAKTVVYEYPGRYAKFFDGVAYDGQKQTRELEGVFSEGDRLAKIRAEEMAVHAVLFAGSGTCPQLLPGHEMTLDRHYNANGSYRVLHVKHHLKCTVPVSSEDYQFDYTNIFECIPQTVPYRPARTTPKPTIHGLQPAVVVCPTGDQVYIDDYGRVQVHFLWDEDRKNSCWIRVGQVFAGPKYGAFFWPRAGHEVLVAFMHGDPDQPVIVGSVYNSANLPPLEHDTLDKYAVGIKTQVVNQDPTHYNALIFFDVPEKSYVYLHSDQHLIDHCNQSRLRRHPSFELMIHGSMAGKPTGKDQ